jgi:hypothetical protein
MPMGRFFRGEVIMRKAPYHTLHFPASAIEGEPRGGQGGGPAERQMLIPKGFFNFF